MDSLKHAEWQELLKLLSRSDAAAGSNQTMTDAAWSEVRTRLRAYARKIARLAPDDIDDVVQAVLLKLQDPAFITRLRNTRAPAAYIVVSLRHAATDIARVRARERVKMARYGLSLLTPQLGPSGRETRLTELGAALARLSEDERALLRLRFWRDLSIAQIAEQQGVTYSTMAVRLFRLLRKLRSEIARKR